MVTRLSGGLTPADGADPRTFPAIWNTTAGTIESQGSAITVAEGDIASQGSAIAVLEGDSLPTDVVSPVSGDSLVYDGTDWVNGPRSGNAIINGDFGVWQRGTSFSGVNVYTADRWLTRFADGTLTTTRQSFSPADIEAIGYGDGEYFARRVVTGASSNNTNRLVQRIEDVRTLAGQTATLSFWAKGDSAFDVRGLITQVMGSGGSATLTPLNSAVSITTSWARYSFTFTMSSVSGSTIGSSSYVEVGLMQTSSLTDYTLDIWGVQLEAGSVATPFRPAGGGSKAAELALCQRYYQFLPSTERLTETITTGLAYSTSATFGPVLFPKMRDTPSVTTTGTFAVTTATGTRVDAGTVQIFFIGNGNLRLDLSSVPGSPLVAGDASVLYATSSGAKIMLDAEL